MLPLLTEAYATQAFLGLALDLGWETRLRAGATVETLLEGFHPPSAAPARWMMDFLAHEGILEAHDGSYVLRGALPADEREGLRALAEAEAPGNLVNLDLLDAIRKVLPPFFTEGRPGEELIFGIELFPLWLAYFQNTNLLYRVNNLLSLAALRPALRPGARVLEVGGGVGSFAHLLSQEPDVQLGAYVFTDGALPFLRRAQRVLPDLAPNLPLHVQRLDLDLPLDAQGLADQTFDAIVAINVLHVVRDLPRTLADLRAHLAPGGRLVLGECLKPSLDTPLYLEGCFQFIRSFRDVTLHPQLRPTPGFLTPEHWVALLRHVGFSEVLEIPHTRPLMERYACFNVGAFAGFA